jgi:hypothetical protein
MDLDNKIQDDFSIKYINATIFYLDKNGGFDRMSKNVQNNRIIGIDREKWNLA